VWKGWLKMTLHRRHYERFWEATIWLTLLGTLTAGIAIAVAYVRGLDLAAVLYDQTGTAVSTGLGVTTAVWTAGALAAGFSVAFVVGRSLRLGAAAALTALACGVAGVVLAGHGVDITGLRAHMLFADPTRKWQFAVLWLVPGAALLTAAVFAIADEVGTARPGPGGMAPHDPREPTAGNEALHWHGSTNAGVGAQSNARERL